MKISDRTTRSLSSLARVSFRQNLAEITNVCATWCPESSGPAGLIGSTSAGISFYADSGYSLIARIMHMPNDHVGLTLTYTARERRTIARPMLWSAVDRIALEIDVEPRTSRVVFWLNDRGWDMGVLPGFERGAQQVSWDAFAAAGACLIMGKFVDCGYATRAGWFPADLSKSVAGHSNLQTHHRLEMLAQNSFAVGDKRFMA